MTTLTTHELSHLVGQILVGGFDGYSVPPEFAAAIGGGRVGGVILFARNIATLEQVASLVTDLRSIEAPRPLLIAIDQEGGRVQRLRAPFPELPPMRKFGRVGRKSLAYGAGELLGNALKLLGIHQDYAPVLDVDSNPDNPVIGDRSFGRDPAVVSRLGCAFIEGMQSAGVAACAKHFPGHGDTNTDSHLELPTLDHDLDRLEAVELAPFRAAIHTDVAAVMTAHILFRALDEQHPATLSDRILQPLLRERLGYKGVIVSDDLEMKAIADNYGIEDSSVRAIRAGCDQLLICHDLELLEQANEALVRAVQTGALPEPRLMEAATNVARLKETYVSQSVTPISDDISGKLPTEAHVALLAALKAGPSNEVGADEEIVEYEFEGDPDLELELEV